MTSSAATTKKPLLNRRSVGLALTAILASAGAAPPADVIVRGAKVVSLDSHDRVAAAVAVTGDRIVAVGTDEEIARLAGPKTSTIDARGKTLLPGLYDSHVHPLGASSSESDHPLPSFDSLAAVLAYIKSRVKAQSAGTWIVVRYAFPTRLKEGRFPTRAELDAVAPDHLVLHQGGPAGVVNTRALMFSGITRNSPDPPAGRIVRDPATGEPTGMLRNAYAAIKGLPTDAYGGDGGADPRRVKDLFRRYNARGLTSVADREATVEALGLYRDLRDHSELTVRINATRVLRPPKDGDRPAIIKGLNALAGYETPGEPNGPSGVGDRWVRIGPLKVYLDGGMLNGTAYMREPWGVGPAFQITEPEYRGQRFIGSHALGILAEEAARRGWQMTAHTAGEAGMDVLLDAYEQAERTIGIRGRRWLITHANFTSAQNLARCVELGVGADMQPAWIWKDTRTLLEVLGPRRMEWFHPYRKWLDAGLTIGGGSDHMIRMDVDEATNPWDPWLGIWVAVTRQTEFAGVLNADQKLTRLEALRFYTINNARLHFEEHDKGTIEPGKLADLILVDRDPLTCTEQDLRSTRVLWTMVGGKLVYRAE
jgi:predicted amidohydrolase YtcJ